MDAYTAGFIGGALVGLLIGAIGTLFVGAVKDERRDH